MTTVTGEKIAPEAAESAAVDGIPAAEPDKAVVLHSRNGEGVLSIDPHQTKWTPAQVTGLRSIGVETEGEDAVPFPYVWQFLHMCQKTDLDPWMREAYLITHGKRWRNDNGEEVDNRKFTLVTGIDGFRKKAEDTGQYAGQVGPQWCGEDGVWKDFWNPKWGKPTASRVGILRRGFTEPVWGVAMYDEFVPMVDEYAEVEKQGKYGKYMKREKTGVKTETPMWQKMGANQIAKCAEAQGFRKAFPRTMAGMYEAAEMQRAQADYQQQQDDERARQEAERDRQLTQRRRDAMDTAKGNTGEPVAVADAVEAVVETIRPEAPGPQSTAPSDAPDTPVEAPSDALSDDAKHALLMEEIQFQAELFGKSVNGHAMRLIKAHKKPPKDWTVEQLVSFLGAQRPFAVEALRSAGRTDEADDYATYGPDEVVQVTALGVHDAEIVPDPADNPALDADPEGPHVYVDDGGLCAVCGEEDQHRLHHAEATGVVHTASPE